MTQQSIPHRTRAQGFIEVNTYSDTPYDQPTEGMGLHRLRVTETFRGDIEGEGQVEFLQAVRSDGSAAFVGIERVTGTLGGRSGTFLLQDQGTLVDGQVRGQWFVVPGSGTGALAGLRGEGSFTAALGQHAEIILDYWFH